MLAVVSTVPRSVSLPALPARSLAVAPTVRLPSPMPAAAQSAAATLAVKLPPARTLVVTVKALPVASVRATVTACPSSMVWPLASLTLPLTLKPAVTSARLTTK
ncbi:hypothetical protein D3C84_957420 [compost metagenome]